MTSMGHCSSLIPCQDLAFYSHLPLVLVPQQKRLLNCSSGFSGGCHRPSAISEESMKRRKEWKRKRRGREEGKGNKESGKSKG